MSHRWSLNRPHPALMVRQGYVIRRTLKAGQDAAISNDNCKEVITKYVCLGKRLPPNPLVLLASF